MQINPRKFKALNSKALINQMAVCVWGFHGVSSELGQHFVDSQSVSFLYMVQETQSMILQYSRSIFAIHFQS